LEKDYDWLSDICQGIKRNFDRKTSVICDTIVEQESVESSK